MSSTRPIVWLVLVAVATASAATAIHRARPQTPTRTATAGALLHNQWKLFPAGTSVALPGDMPGTIVPIPGTHFAVVNTCGYHDHSVNLVDVSTQTVVQSIIQARDWVGMAYDPSRGELFVSGGSGQAIKKKKRVTARAASPAEFEGALLRFKFSGDRLEQERAVDIPDLTGADQFVSGVLSDGKGTLYVANIQTDTVYRLSGDDLGVVANTKVGYRPYGLALSPDGKSLAVSNWGDQSVSLLDASTLAIKERVAVGVHPNAVAYGPEELLYVANAGSNSVSVIEEGRVRTTIRTSLDSTKVLGTTPVSLAISGGRLYVANADDNDVAVVDIAKPKAMSVLGFIPTGRYPSAISCDGRQLLVATAKGLHDNPSASEEQAAASLPVGPDGIGRRGEYTYVAQLLQGNLSFVNVPTEASLAKYTFQVRSGRPHPSFNAQEAGDVLKNAMRRIHHVIYVIRENRTYDQVLGDVKKGNGDARLTLFPEPVTPNSHRFANQFVLLDNLYCDGEVSQVGHQWTDAAYANDYTEKAWILSYSGRPEVQSDTRMFTSPGGYLWQNALRHGKTSRIYGEYLQWQEDHNSAHGEVKADPEKFGCSKAFEEVFARGGRDTEKTAVFLKEMHEAERTGKWPNLMVIALNEDHTNGASPGRHTPWAMVGSNDLALGQLVEGVSHSAFWKDTAIFVIQDDAQDGPDHVDAHRTVGHVISPYTQRGGVVDSTMFSTCSMIRTMELILDLPAMSQYDALARPMFSVFTTKPDFSPYMAVKPRIDLDAMNPEKGELAERSKKIDLIDIDEADPAEFNAILWAQLKPGQPMPAPVVGHWGR